jgi:FkbH-like protein
MEFEKIKLVIWDLDNTFWSGTISEVEIQPVQKNIDLVKSLTDCGIINSICSKNTFEVAVGKLQELNVFDYFVFPSIEWSPKGQRVRNLIKTMSLRPENVLFLDDEVTNMEEAKHYSQEIMVAGPDKLPELMAFVAASKKSDPGHTRLEQYKVLEKKEIELKKYESNEDFLYASNIKVGMVTDCIPELERIHDLLMRTNQLNYTKKRIPINELEALLGRDDAQCGYVTVEDKFGNYGIVGFYALLNNNLEHFLFSCRTIGIGVEQYVYSKLNCPELEVVGEVVSRVKNVEAPLWINHNRTIDAPVVAADNENVISTASKFLFKSPCNFAKSIAYVKNNEMIHCEFNYVSQTKGNVIEAHNHTIQVLGLKEYSQETKQEILNDCTFFDEGVFSGSIFNKKYDVVFLSTLSESYAGIYKKKNSEIKVTVGTHIHPITDKTQWDGLIDGRYYSSENKFTEEYLKEFSEKYDFVGKTTPEDYRFRINKLLDYLDNNTKLCLILGVEFPCENNLDPFFKDMHISHAQINNVVREMAAENPRVICLDLNEFVKHQDDFGDNMNQFKPKIYYDISQKIISIIHHSASTKVENFSTLFIYFDMLLNFTKKITKSVIPEQSALHRNLQIIFHKLSRKRV